MYKPAEDSIFFSEFLKEYFSNLNSEKKQKLAYLDMGTGSGILSETAVNAGLEKQNIFAVDIEQESIKYAENKLKIKTVKSNLFSNPELKNKKFDLITFNAPYLPKNEYDKQSDTTGGKNGDEVSLKFLKQAKKHLKQKGKIFLLISNLTPQERIKKFKPDVIARKKLFFEELLILRVE